MMDLNQWYEREDLQVALSKMLADPVLKTALEVLVNHGLPSGQVLPPGTSPIEHGALMNARREGYFEFFRNLERLPKKPAALKPRTKAWQGSHIFGDDKPE